MDEFQRFQLSYRLPHCWTCFKCVTLNWAELPDEMLNAVQEGDVDSIKEYLEKGGDVNALSNGESLLSRSCEHGQIEIVKLLLQCPEIHLNITLESSPPFNRAVRGGHLQCANLLMDSKNCSCMVEPHRSWRWISSYLKTKPLLSLSSATYLMQFAIRKAQLDIVQILLETKHHFLKETLHPLALVAIEYGRWDVVFSVLKREFHGKMEYVDEILTIAVHMRGWESVEKILYCIDSELKFDIAFVEAALSGRHPQAQKLLVEEQYDFQTLNGNLLVVAAGGTSGPIAELLMTVKNVYSQGTFANALILAAFTQCAELFPRLLHNPEASYSTYVLHQANDALQRDPRLQGNSGFLATYFLDYLKKSLEIN